VTAHRFVIPGNPIPKARPRVARGHAYTPKRTTDAEDVVKLYAKRARVRCLAGPVRLSLSFYRDSAQPCDLDNLVKLVSDALNGIAFKDDRQVVVLSALKAIDRENPRTEVAIEDASIPLTHWKDEVGAYPTDGEPERDRCEKCRRQVMPQDFAPDEPVICFECAEDLPAPVRTPEAA
jgi:crossover junction endodeoxyribonuclease RusA